MKRKFMQESGVFMNKRVYNKTFGKIVRTLGFIFILVSSVFLAVQLILTYQTLPFIENLLPYAELVNDAIAPYAFISEYAVLALIVGEILILWAIRRGLILRVLLTVTLIFLFVENSFAGQSVLVPIAVDSPAWLGNILGFIEGPFEQLVALSEYIIPGVTVAVPFLLWVLYAYKKPGRFSIFMLRLGSITLFLAIAMLIVKNLFVPSLQDVEVYGTITTVFYILTYLLNAVGGVFGTLGFARK
jgi:type IV secretory pathway VirB2 component (pilin)